MTEPIRVLIEPHAHRALRGVRVLRDVGQRLGHDPVAGHLDRRGQVGQAVARSVQGNGEGRRLVLQTANLFTQGPDQAELV